MHFLSKCIQKEIFAVDEEEFGMNYQETMGYIEELGQYGSILGLENMERLLERLGNPQDELEFVHIAGTNGKGSVLAYVSTVLMKAGYKVGRYISPVIFGYREKIQINGKEIGKTELSRYMGRVKEVIDQMAKEGRVHPTLFEVETALAFLYFKEKGCRIVVLETGLGGALDATNVIKTAKAAVLTAISMDHMAYLGETLGEIAEAKAGIIKKGCSVISTVQHEEAMEVIRRRCLEMGSSLVVADYTVVKRVKSGIKRQIFSYKSYRDVEITMLGHHQIENAVAAIETIEELGRQGFTVTEGQLRKGLSETVWQGRFSLVEKAPYFIVDGAHNEDAAKRLADSIRFYFTNRRIIYIIGVLKDKEYDRILRETYVLAEHIITVTSPRQPRAMHAYDLAKAVSEYHPSVTAADSLAEAVEMSYLLADKETVIIAFGSLSYLGEIIDLVKNRDKTRSRHIHGGSKKD